MTPEWKDPAKESPVKKDDSSVCVMVSPGHPLSRYPMKSWWDGVAYWLANGEKAEVVAWDYCPEHASK